MDTSGLIAQARMLYRRIFEPADAGSTALPAPIRATGRWVVVFYRQLERDRAFERAGSLAYITLFGLVPALMLVFAVLDASGISEGGAIEALVFDTFLGDIPQVRQFLAPELERVNLGALGAIGTLGWMYIAFRIYMTMEVTYSEMFRVRVTRTLGRRLMNFYLALTAGPVLIGLALFGTVEAAERLGVAGWGNILSILLPMVLLIGAIRLLPCTTVDWGPALAGGVVSGLLIQGGVQGFSLYTRTFAARDPVLVLYGSIGIIPFFLLWLWLVWVFVLLGVEVAYVAQNFKSLVRAEREQQQEDERRLRVPSLETAIELAATVAWHFQHGLGPVDDATLGERCRIPTTRVSEVLEVLEEAGLVTRTDTEWIIARPPADTPLRDVARAWREATTLRREGKHPLYTDVDRVLEQGLTGTLADAAERWVEAPPPGDERPAASGVSAVERPTK